MGDRHNVRLACGWTVVELLVSIGIVAILISLLLPPLAGARKMARQTASMSNLRQIGSVFVMYAKDSDDLCPAIIEGRMYQISRDMSIGYPYWQVSEVWPGVIYDYLPFDDAPGVYISPGSWRNEYPSSYVYSTSFVGSPLLWRSGAEARPEYEQGQRISNVRFPSGKTLLWDNELGYARGEPRRLNGDLGEGAPLAMADGSVQVLIPASASVPVPNPLWGPLVNPPRLHNTENGVKGLDY